MKKTIKIWWLKRQLGKTYESIYYKFEDYDCGHTLLLAISSDYLKLCVKFNRIADKLSKIDPKCPTYRYKL